MNKIIVASFFFVLLAAIGSLIFFKVFTTKMSEVIFDENAGFNGSFEYTVDGLPVNWMLYTQATVREGEFQILLDSSKVYEGKQSLKFDVRSCSPTGGNRSPGFIREIPAKSGHTYQVSFWILNNGCKLRAKIGGVSPARSDTEIILQTEDAHNDWHQISHQFKIADEFSAIQFEFSVLGPGTCWIDEVAIDEVMR